MNSASRIARPAILSETASQWQQAIRGNDHARTELLRRIMPAHGRRAR